MFQDLNPLDRSTAIMEIIILMLVAAIIGFVIAWLYYRSIYRKKISELETKFSDYRAKHVPKVELEASQSALAAMTDGRNDLRIALATCKQQRQTAETELVRVKGDLSAAAAARDKCASELAALRDQLNAAWAKSKDLQGNWDEEIVRKNALNAELERIEGENKHLVVLQAEAKAEIGKLESALEICRNKETAAAVAIPLVTQESPAVPAPKKKAGKASKEEKLAAIREKRGLINFDRIGLASFEDRDDLKVISGIGPFIEEKLNALGIFTFVQVSNFIDEDVETITKAIAFFPGRIQRDNWVSQATELAKG
ncbi:MAG TPA: hypothetical protein ENJ82_01975 [Bacteroidetes bacterium]|nr:hypothetical protein [Bacteroidota bacterium]